MHVVVEKKPSVNIADTAKITLLNVWLTGVMLASYSDRQEFGWDLIALLLLVTLINVYITCSQKKKKSW